MADLQRRLDEKIDTSVERILLEYAAVAFTPLTDLVRWHNQGLHVIDSDRLTAAQAASVASVKVHEQRRLVGDDEQIITRTIEVKQHKKIGALDSLARYRRMFADAVMHLHFDPAQVLKRANARLERAQREDREKNNVTKH
jgi:hypothetical protein